MCIDIYVSLIWLILVFLSHLWRINKLRIFVATNWNSASYCQKNKILHFCRKNLNIADLRPKFWSKLRTFLTKLMLRKYRNILDKKLSFAQGWSRALPGAKHIFNSYKTVWRYAQMSPTTLSDLVLSKAFSGVLLSKTNTIHQSSEINWFRW